MQDVFRLADQLPRDEIPTRQLMIVAVGVVEVLAVGRQRIVLKGEEVGANLIAHRGGTVNDFSLQPAIDLQDAGHAPIVANTSFHERGKSCGRNACV